jgi:hypothetical protein
LRYLQPCRGPSRPRETLATLSNSHMRWKTQCSCASQTSDVFWCFHNRFPNPLPALLGLKAKEVSQLRTGPRFRAPAKAKLNFTAAQYYVFSHMHLHRRVRGSKMLRRERKIVIQNIAPLNVNPNAEGQIACCANARDISALPT